MAIGKIPGAAAPQISPAVDAGKEKFGKVLDGVKKAAPSEVGPKMVAPPPQKIDAVPTHAKSVSKAASGKSQVGPTPKVEAAKVLDQVAAAQQRLDKVLAIAQSGKAFTP